MSFEPQNQDWSFVEHALEEGACSGFKIAILESEKIFQQMLKNCPFKRTTVMNELPRILSEPEKFFRARQTAEKIILEPSFEITREDTKNIIAAYWRGVQDFGDWLEGVGLMERQFLKIKHYFSKKAFAKAGIFLFLLILFIQFANKTRVGGNAIAFVADWNDFLFWKIIIAVGAGVAAGIGYKISKIYINK